LCFIPVAGDGDGRTSQREHYEGDTELNGGLHGLGWSWVPSLEE
jgi:hypothetical protein